MTKLYSELSIHEQVQTILGLSADAGMHCELIHREDGKLREHHSDEGPLWILEIVAPCCNTSSRKVLCDKVHSHLLEYLEHRKYIHVCEKCGKSMTFKDAYTGSIRWD